MRTAAGIALLLVACGRVGFDGVAALDDAGVDGAGPDGAPPVPDSCTLAFGPPSILSELSGRSARGPSVSGDGLTIYFGGDGATSTDLWSATRTDPAGEFGEPMLVVGTGDIESDPAVSLDHRELFFSRGGCIAVARRASPSDPWDPPVTIDSTCGGSGAALSDDNLALYFTVVDPTSRLAVVRRPDRESPFGPSAAVPLPITAGYPFIGPGERTLLFESDTGGLDYDLFVATRADASAMFDPPTPIATLNLDGIVDEDAHLWTGGNELFFSSNRGSGFDIYRSAVTCLADP